MLIETIARSAKDGLGESSQKKGSLEQMSFDFRVTGRKWRTTRQMPRHPADRSTSVDWQPGKPR